jgi:hypothetical protein
MLPHIEEIGVNLNETTGAYSSFVLRLRIAGILRAEL